MKKLIIACKFDKNMNIIMKDILPYAVIIERLKNRPI